MNTFLAQLSLLSANPLCLSTEQQAKIQTVLDEVVPIGSNLIACLIALITPAFTYVNPDLTDEHFPSVDVPNPEGGELEHYGKGVSSDYVLADLRRRNRRAATAAENLRYWHEHPECRQYWVVALGQVWNGQVLVLREYGGDRCAYLHRVADGWYAGCRFLSFPL